MASAVADRGDFFGSLESLRGIAALIVVCYHADWTNAVSGLPLVQNGALMVDFFFVLSGFVIFHSYGARLATGRSVAKFMWLRLGRLYPLHLTFLLVFVGLEFCKWIAARRYGLVFDKPPFSVNNGHAFVANLLLTDALGFERFRSFNFPSWSISTEFYTYLLFALLRLAVPSRRAFLWISGVIVLASASVLLGVGRLGLADAGPHWAEFRCTGGFFLGVLTGAAYAALKARARVPGAATAWLNAVPAIALLVIAVFLARPLTGAWAFALPVLAAGVILSVVLAPESLTVAALNLAPLRWLGKVSYSVYMVHAAFAWMISQVLYFKFHVPRVLVDQERVLIVAPGPGLALLVGYVCVVLVTSELTFRLIEAPFRERSRLLAQRWFARSGDRHAFPARSP